MLTWGHTNLSLGSSRTKLHYTTPGVLLAGAPLDLEQRGVLVLVPLAALVAGEHRLRVQTSRHHRDGASVMLQLIMLSFKINP